MELKSEGRYDIQPTSFLLIAPIMELKLNLKIFRMILKQLLIAPIMELKFAEYAFWYPINPSLNRTNNGIEI